MPIKVTDLEPGDRVVLNCPRSRVMAKREAQFEGIFRSVEEAMRMEGGCALLMGTSTAAFLSSGQAWARFLMRRGAGGDPDLVGAFLIEPDGSLREEEGRQIFIEQRMRMGRG